MRMRLRPHRKGESEPFATPFGSGLLRFEVASIRSGFLPSVLPFEKRANRRPARHPPGLSWAYAVLTKGKQQYSGLRRRKRNQEREKAETEARQAEKRIRRAIAKRVQLPRGGKGGRKTKPIPYGAFPYRSPTKELRSIRKTGLREVPQQPLRIPEIRARMPSKRRCAPLASLPYPNRRRLIAERTHTYLI